MNVIGRSVEIQIHIGGSLSKWNTFPFTSNIAIPGDSLFVVLAKLPEDESLSPVGFYATEEEARKAISFKGFEEVAPQ